MIINKIFSSALQNETNINYNNFCGVDYNSINCAEPCPSGLDSGCTYPDTCINAPNLCFVSKKNITMSFPNYNYCGIDYKSIKYTEPCPGGSDKECINGGSCFKAPEMCVVNKAFKNDMNLMIMIVNILLYMKLL